MRPQPCSPTTASTTPSFALTASAAVDLADIAAITSELTGRTIRRVVVSDDEHRAGLLAQGLPEIRVDMAMGIFLASRQGQFARVEPTLARLVDRPPTPMRDVLRASLAV